MIDRRHGELLIGGLSAKECAENFGTPLYVYDVDVIGRNVQLIKDSIPYRPLGLHFACMANGNVQLLKEIKRLSVGAFVCSPGELKLAQLAGFAPDKIAMTAPSLSDDEVEEFAKSEVSVNVDSEDQLARFAHLGGVTRIGFRIAPNVSGPHGVINLAVGPTSRLGIPEDDVGSTLARARELGVTVVGVHMYVGTNIIECADFFEAIERLLGVARQVQTLQYIDIGGGFGVSYRRTSHHFDWPRFGDALSRKMEALASTFGREIELKLEPGRSVAATAGVLLMRVTEVKRKNGYTFVGTNASLSNFPRPYIYHQYHEIELADNEDGRVMLNNVSICGNTAASQDVLSEGLRFPEVRVGDLLAIRDVGAYGYSMSLHFCGRLKPAEVMVKDRQVYLIRKRETADDLARGQIIQQ